MKTRVLTASVSLLILLPLAACSNSAQAIGEEEFQAGISSLAKYSLLDEATLSGLGEDLCSSLEKQANREARETFLNMYSALADDQDGSGNDATMFAAYSIARFCPEMAAK